MNKIRDVIFALKELDLTEYESKIYVSLLQEHPLNGNEISVLSGVPAPKVYETLKRMQKKGLVFLASGSMKNNRNLYTPLPYKELLHNKNKFFSNQINFLETELPKMVATKKQSETELFIIEGYSASIKFIQSEILKSKTSIILSCWYKEFNEISKALHKMSKAKVDIVTMFFDSTDVDIPWRTFKHLNIERAFNRHEGELSIVLDNEVCILFSNQDNYPHAVVSNNPSTVTVTRNYIRHDIYVNRVFYDFKDEIRARYGDNLDLLINDF